ncbi:allophanate hydrolase subunit 1 [Solihabitans fulvus]|uniref:Allophanate hydrolase subunit 1 n=1 Tax=Solihabitans fulvus TaxID=1892852 RepID=A0A5B2XK06_9PSEU|nr:allophanate hydrolase subunit 1 [Solihabitans fulvus]KAA2263484.1 allophanate hydrolase subunit 1 [Solihabitans fulvus]
MRILPSGEHALLVEVADLDAVLALYDGLRQDQPAGIADLVPAARTLLVKLVPGCGAARRASVAEAVATSAGVPRGRTEGQVVEIDVRYDGEDLAEVAALTGLTEREVVDAHTGTPWRVAFCGFVPGFGYLVGGDPRLRVARRSTSRVRVPAGSVALADQFTGVYPSSSPGGWQLIGRTDAVLWDAARQPPALLRPGVTVRFRETA